MDIISGESKDNVADNPPEVKKQKQIEFKQKVVACPLYTGVPLLIPITECKVCPHHRGIEKVTELRGIEVFDILCGLPVRRRVLDIVSEVKENGSAK